MTSRNTSNLIVICAILSLFLMAAVACSNTPEPAAPAPQPAVNTPTQPATPQAVETSSPLPTATAAAAQPPTAEMQTHKRITVAEPFAPSSNGAIETDDAFVLIGAGIIETLVKIDFDGHVKPFLAESWRRADDHTWEFTLREGVTFQDNTHFEADSVAKSLGYLGSVPNPPRGFTADTFPHVDKIDEHTISIHGESPDVLLPTRLAAPPTGVLASAAYDNRDEAAPSPMQAGTGPFILDSDISAESFSVVRNENYWGNDINIDEAQFLFVPEGTVRSAMLETGEVDFVFHLPISQIPVIAENSEFTIRKSQQPRTVTLNVNNGQEPFSNIKVRKAVQHAIDRQAIVDAVLEGVGSPAIGPFAPDEAWVNPDLKEYEFDPERSKTLLNEAGYEEGELTISLWTYPSRAEFPPMSVVIQKMLNDAGFNTEVRLAQWGALAPEVFAGNYEMFLVSRSHLIDAYDPEGFFAADYTCEAVGVSNYSNYCNPEIDELLAQARPMSDPEERYEIYRQIQTILHEEAVTPFINYTEQVYAFNERVRNWQSHLLEYYFMTPELDVVN